MPNDHLFLLNWALQLAEREPVNVRVRLYRAIADVCGDTHERRRLIKATAALDSADAKCREFSFEMSQKLESGDGVARKGEKE